jgi:hypothetical protein
MIRCFLSLVTVNVWLLVSICAASDTVAQGCTLLWAADDVISDLSWARKVPSSFLTDSGRAGLTFLDEETLLVYEVSVNPTELSSRQSPSVSSPYKLRVSVFDLASGRKTSSEQLGTWIRESFVHATSGGIFVQTGNVLRIYSKQLDKLQELVLPQQNQDESYAVSVSPSGKTILVNRYNVSRYNGTSSHFGVLDGGTLRLIQAWTESPPLRRLYSISDTGIAAADFNQQHILWKRFGSGAWEVIGGKPVFGVVGLPLLVSDATLVTSFRPFAYLSTNGGILFEDGLGKYESLEQEASVARDGEAVAVGLDRRKGGDFWDTGKGLQVIARSVVVYNLTLRKRVLEFQLKPLPKNDLGYALSPTGGKLAVLSDRRVAVCAVPQE